MQLHTCWKVFNNKKIQTSIAMFLTFCLFHLLQPLLVFEEQLQLLETIHVLRNQDLGFCDRNDRKVHLYRTIFAELAISCQGAKYYYILLCSSLAQSYFFVFKALIIPSKSSGVKRCPYLYFVSYFLLPW